MHARLDQAYNNKHPGVLELVNWIRDQRDSPCPDFSMIFPSLDQVDRADLRLILSYRIDKKGIFSIHAVKPSALATAGLTACAVVFSPLLAAFFGVATVALAGINQQPHQNRVKKRAKHVLSELNRRFPKDHDPVESLKNLEEKSKSVLSTTYIFERMNFLLEPVAKVKEDAPVFGENKLSDPLSLPKALSLTEQINDWVKSTFNKAPDEKTKESSTVIKKNLTRR